MITSGMAVTHHCSAQLPFAVDGKFYSFLDCLLATQCKQLFQDISNKLVSNERAYPF